MHVHKWPINSARIVQRVRVARQEAQRLRAEKFRREAAASTVLEAAARRYLWKSRWRAQQAGARLLQRVGRGMLGRRAWATEHQAQFLERQRLLRRYEQLMSCQLEEEIVAGLDR